MCSWIGGVEIEPAERVEPPAHDPAHRDDRHLRACRRRCPRRGSRSARGSGSPAPIAAASGSSTSVTRRPPATAPPPRRPGARPPTTRPTAGRQHPRPRERADPDPAEHDLEHPLGHLELGHRTLPERAHGDDVAASPPIIRQASSPIAIDPAACRRSARRRWAGRRRSPRPAGRRGGWPCPRSIARSRPILGPAHHPVASPETRYSFFQMGTSRLSRSMPCGRPRTPRPVRRGERDHDGTSPTSRSPDPVQQRDPADRPPLEHLVRELPEPVLGRARPMPRSEAGDARPVGVVADRAGEDADAARAGSPTTRRPPRRRSDPRDAHELVRSHASIVAGVRRPVRRSDTRPSYSDAEGPYDDGTSPRPRSGGSAFGMDPDAAPRRRRCSASCSA